MGQIYYDMGILASTDLLECSVSELVSAVDTGKKVKELFDRALGKVLFIDEAYRLLQAREATDEIVTLLTQERYRGKLIVILAGYDDEMRRTLRSNRGLSSRFPEEILFPPLSTTSCLEVLHAYLHSHGLQNFTYLKEGRGTDYVAAASIVNQLSKLKSWGNARDMITIGKKLLLAAYSTEHGEVTPRMVNQQLRIMRAERMSRDGVGSKPRLHPVLSGEAPNNPILSRIGSRIGSLRHRSHS